ncbi:TraB/GumN family protein [Novosphingobium sp.]|uniref:TraB/GumN family protein n=1 Tax=Novosphingobium sp. TaxID=1874826 RepID=UPI00286C8CA1|nr:TraB/GumN family protein [Novosphingobium sp.]
MFNSAGRLLLGLIAALTLAGCAAPQDARPALWLVEGPGGAKAWLFGTIHGLRDPVNWRSDTVEAALAQSDRLILEVADIENQAATAQAFAELAQGGPHPPLLQRVPPGDADDLAAELAQDRIAPGSLDRYDTWAAALMIAQAQASLDRQDSANGIDRALAASYRGPIGELEGARAQLAIFDALPEAQQRALLGAVIDEDAAARSTQARALEQAWAKGDVAAIARVSDAETFGDPVLRDALLVGRNRAWTIRLIALLGARARPFIAVGAAHMAGPDGLPAMLAAQGYTVTRLQ